MNVINVHGEKVKIIDAEHQKSVTAIKTPSTIYYELIPQYGTTKCAS